MNALSPWAILLFGIALGVCLPVVLRAAHRRLRRTFFRPTLLHLDPPPASRRKAPGAGPESS